MFHFKIIGEVVLKFIFVIIWTLLLLSFLEFCFDRVVKGPTKIELRYVK